MFDPHDLYSGANFSKVLSTLLAVNKATEGKWGFSLSSKGHAYVSDYISGANNGQAGWMSEFLSEFPLETPKDVNAFIWPDLEMIDTCHKCSPE